MSGSAIKSRKRKQAQDGQPDQVDQIDGVGRFGQSSDEAGPSRPRRRTDKERDVNEAKAKIELDEGLRGQGKGKAREEILVEKSNVMMVYVARIPAHRQQLTI